MATRFLPGMIWGRLYVRARHYKGDVYEVQGRALQVGTGEPMVVYRSERTGLVFVRPEEEFCGVVDGYTPRFTLIPLQPPPQASRE